MASLQTQIEALAGSATNALQWANDGIRAVVDRVLAIDPESGYLFAQELSGSTSGANVTERQHVLSVAVSSKTATEIPASKRFVAAEATSLQKATADYPQYYVLNQKLFVIPSGSFTYSVVDYTTLANLNSAAINNFPTSLIPAVVNYAAMKSLNERMVGYTGLSGLSLTLPSVPPQPTLDFSVTDALSTINTGDLSNVTLPQYVSVADPNITELDLSSHQAPVLPETPKFLYEDAELQKFFGDLSVSFTTTPPTYSAPSFKPIDFSKISSLIEVEEDIELAQVKLSEEQSKVSEFSALVQDSLNAFNKDNTEYQIQYQKSVQEFESKVSKRIQEMQLSTNVDLQNKAKSLEKDVSEYSSKLQRFTQDLQRYQADMNQSMQEWTVNNLQYKLSKWNSDVQENLNEYQARVGATMQKYSADISKMGAITQTEVNKLGGNLQKDSAKNAVEMQRFTSLLQKYSQQSQIVINEFNSKMQKAQLEYQWLEKQYALVSQQFEKGFEPFLIRRQGYGGQDTVRG